MPTLRVTEEQIVELVKQLSAEQKRAVLLALAADAVSRREARMAYAEDQLRRLA